MYVVSLLKTLWKQEKLLITSNFSFSHSVYYPFGKDFNIFIKFEVVICKLFQFGGILKFVILERVLKFIIWERVLKFIIWERILKFIIWERILKFVIWERVNLLIKKTYFFYSIFVQPFSLVGIIQGSKTHGGRGGGVGGGWG